MNSPEYCQVILREIEIVVEKIDTEEMESLVDAITGATRVFTAGTGRSLLMVRALAMRLMQLGYDAFVVGETVTPAIGPDDLFIIGSGSGETATLHVMASQAKAAGARLALVTIFPNSTLGRLADLIVKIPAATSKSGKPGGSTSAQPGASLFEQCLLVLADAIIMRISEKTGIQDINSGLMKRHANLE